MFCISGVRARDARAPAAMLYMATSGSRRNPLKLEPIAGGVVNRSQQRAVTQAGLSVLSCYR
jgi:hypothetical protein